MSEPKTERFGQDYDYGQTPAPTSSDIEARFEGYISGVENTIQANVPILREALSTIRELREQVDAAVETANTALHGSANLARQLVTAEAERDALRKELGDVVTKWNAYDDSEEEHLYPDAAAATAALKESARLYNEFRASIDALSALDSRPSSGTLAEQKSDSSAPLRPSGGGQAGDEDDALGLHRLRAMGPAGVTDEPDGMEIR